MSKSSPPTVPISRAVVTPESVATDPKPVLPPSPEPAPPAGTNNQAKATIQITPPQTQSAPVDEPHQDQLARAALSLVGTDNPDAEAYWLGAIFDTTLSDQEREDLMEDLNEEGLVNPGQATPQDYPLIYNRLRIIEEVAPYADEFMLEHLAEAYKDLMNLAEGGIAN